MTESLGRIVIVNPGSDVYGSDLQMLESIRAFVNAGALVDVVIPSAGPLVPLVTALKVNVETFTFPVLRRSDQTPLGMLKLSYRVLMSMPRMVRFLRRTQASVVYVNTLTIPWWLVAARMAGARTICHVHEAERGEAIHARIALYGPLLLAHSCIMISQAAMRAAAEAVPRISSRSVIIPNGVPDRPQPPHWRQWRPPCHVGVVARLSPRKGTMTALDAVAMVRSSGIDVELHLFGSVFEGYEWYEGALRKRAGEADLAGAVHFHGYVRPAWDAFDRVDIVLAPSIVEPYGNSVVEAQYSLRPVIATCAEGHLESIVSGDSGILVPIDDAKEMARALHDLIDDENLAHTIASQARRDAISRNSVNTYAQSVVDVVARVTRESGDGHE